MKHKPTSIVLTETWNTSISAQLCNLDGYNGVHVYRDRMVTSGGVGGGVSVFFKDNLNGNLVDILSTCDDTIEICVCRIESGNTYIIIIGIYRPHSDTVPNFVNRLDYILSHDIIKNADTVLLAGDINIDLCDQTSMASGLYSSLLQSTGFLPAITRPTRFYQRIDFNNLPSFDHNVISGSNLDHIWINRYETFISAIILVDLTDHMPTCIFFHHQFTIDNTTSEKICIKRRPFSEINLNSLMLDLNNTNWDSVFSGNTDQIDVNITCKKFCKHLDRLYCKNFPLKIKYISQKRASKPWLNDEIKKLINKKSNSLKNYRLGLITKAENNVTRNIVNCAVRNAKRKYYLNAYNQASHDIGKSWNITRELMGINRPKSTIDKMLFDNVEYTQPLDIANQFNRYFCSIGEELDAQLPPFTNDTNSNFVEQINSFFLKPFEIDECLKLIQELKNSKSDIDCLPVEIFKKIATIIAPTLTSLINNSFNYGQFPDFLKIARITAVYKKGDKRNPSNYRPISSLPFVSKIFEKSMANRLMKFFDKYNIINATQFGFQRNKSTTHAIECLTDIMYGNLNHHKITVNVLIDLKKAFDTVNHSLLLDKLYKCGIRGISHLWFKNYLSNRMQYVGVGYSNSSLRPINIGVPQGSVLGPILFLVFINDLPDCSNLRTTLFADDTTLSISSHNYDDLVTDLNFELLKIHDWVVSNRLTINVDKTELMLISNKNVNSCNEQIFLNGRSLNFTDNAMFLGMKLDNKLKFSDHIHYINDKISKNIGIFSKIRDNLPMKTRKDYYNCLVFPYISQNIIIWGGAYSTHLIPLITAQKRMIRLMVGADYLANTNIIFFQLKLLKLEDIYKYFLCIHIFKERSKGKYCTQHVLSTRNRDLAQPVFQRLTMCQQSVSFKGPTIWNTLPIDIRSIERLTIFKKHLKEYLLNQYAE